MEHDDGVAFLESAFREGLSSLLEDDCDDGSGVIDEGDFIEKLCFYYMGFNNTVPTLFSLSGFQ